ncbi:N-acetylglucosamine-6-phosphate deacetylase [Colletotrichum siamense]|nr:N-acetylglucosamine-6-phosphate deacetylase [Colletotrichum siamense]
MPIAIPKTPKNGITKFTNCRLVKGDALVQEDIWVSSVTGKIIHSQAAFFDDLLLPDETVNLGGRIVSPGMIDCQLNGAFGFNFSTLLEDMSQYGKKVRELNRKLALPYLGPSGGSQVANDGAESLGAHVEGPFLNPTKNGIHNVDVLQQAETFDDLVECYGAKNIEPSANGGSIPIKMITAAPERGRMTQIIPELRERGIIYSIGHSEATYEEASAAVAAGATMITHLFNAMRPLHHRNPGVFGVLGIAESLARPYFGIISDGIHLHPTTIKIAFNAHPDGFILVTDAMHMMGLADGSYKWTNGQDVNNIVKVGSTLLLEGTDKIAGSAVTLMECVNNFLRWSGTGIPKALKAVTATPAEMLGLKGIKGSLEDGADADLVIFSEEVRDGATQLVVDEVWKAGTMVSSREETQSPIA